MNEAGRRRPIWRASARWLALAVLLGGPASPHAAEPAAAHFATVVELDGAIGPAMSRYITGALADAAREHSSVVILQMDTPGGLDTAMREIIKAILASPIPVVTYVAPSGARAASAGTYILYASQLAAMAPGTNLGAATPISLGGSEEPSAAPSTAPAPPAPPTPGVPDAASNATRGQHAGATSPTHPAPGAHAATGAAANPPTSSPPSAPAEEPATASERKAVNDAVAYIRSLAQLSGRNAEWAERAVRGAASLSAEDALQQHVVEFIAKDVPDLLSQMNGRRVRLSGGEIVLRTSGLAVEHVAPDWRTRVLLVLTHPTIAYGLLLAGIWGLLLEGYHPGAALPGVVGALALLVSLYALQLLAVNFAGLALIALGIGLIIMEFFMPSFGSLGIGGLAAFVIGSIILFDSGGVGAQVAWPVIAGIAIAGALVIAAVAALAARARRKPITTGAEAMIGEPVQVISATGDTCVVRYGGELWNAQASRPLRAGQRASIVRVRGLTLWIEPQPNSQPAPPGYSPQKSPSE